MRVQSKLAIVVIGLALVFPSHAGGALGGLAGAFKALSEDLEKKEDFENQKALIQRQHDLEMRRIELEHQLRMQMDERARQAAAQKYQEEQRSRIAADLAEVQAAKTRQAQAVADRVAREQENERIVEAVHPGWKAIVNSKTFDKWASKQPRSIAALAESERVQDAILMIDLFKRDTKTVKVKLHQ